MKVSYVHQLLILLAAAVSGSAQAAPSDSRCFQSRILETAGETAGSRVVFAREDWVRKYVHEFAAPASHDDNLRFVRLKSAGRGKLFFEMENPILKEMNGKIFGEQDLSTAVTNKYKEIFFQKLQHASGPEMSRLREAVLAKYSDYKSVRLMLTEDSPELRTALARVYEETAKDFRNYIRSLDLIHAEGGPTPLTRYFENERGIAGDPALFQLAGIGKTAEEAGVAARGARNLVPEFHDALAPFAVQFEKIAPQLITRLRAAELARKTADAAIPRDSGIFVASRRLGDSERVLSVESIEIFRRAKSSNEVSARDLRSYLDYLRERFEKRFGVTLNDSTLEQMRAYFNHVDSFSPGVFSAGPAETLTRQEGPGLFLDFIGLGSKNIQSTMEALLVPFAKKNAGTLTAQTEAVREALLRSVEEMEHVNSAFLKQKTTLAQLARGGAKSVSGDEWNWFHRLTGQERLSFLRELSSKMPPSDFRTAYIQGTLAEGGPISASFRDRLKDEAHLLEKSLRSAIETPANRQALKNIQIHIDVLGSATGGARIDLVLSGAGASPQIAQQIKTHLPEVLSAMGRDANEAVGTPVMLELGSVRLNR